MFWATDVSKYGPVPGVGQSCKNSVNDLPPGERPVVSTEVPMTAKPAKKNEKFLIKIIASSKQGYFLGLVLSYY